MATERVNLFFNSKGAGKVKGEVAQIGLASKAASKATAGLKTQLGLVMAAFGLAKAVQTVASFGQEMATVKAITASTATEFDLLREKAKDLGATTRFSSTEAAEAMKFLGRAGFDSNEILGAVGGTLNLAQAGALDLGRAADIASNVLTGFNMTTEETGRVVDVLAKAANSSNTDVEQLGQAMKFVAPVAAGLGVEMETTAAAISVLSDAGIQGAMAGTNLRMIMSQMMEPTKKAREELARFGLSAEDISLKTNTFTEAVTKMADKGLEVDSFLKIFNTRSGPAAAIISQNIHKLKELDKAYLNSAGSASEFAEIMDDTLMGAIKKFISASEAFILAIGDLGFTKALKFTIESIASAIRTVANALSYTKEVLILLTPLMIGLFGGGVLKLAIFGITAAIKGLYGATLLLTKAFVRLAIVMNAHPLIALGTLLTGIIMIIYKFRNQIKLGGDSVANFGDVFTVLKDRWQNFWNVFKRDMEGFRLLILEYVPQFEGVFRLFDDIKDGGLKTFIEKVADMLDLIADLFRATTAAIKNIWENMTADMANFFRDNLIEGALKPVFKKLEKLPGGKLLSGIAETLFKESLPGIKKTGKTAGEAFTEELGKGITNSRDFVDDFFVDAEKAAQDRLKNSIKGIDPPFETIGDSLESFSTNLEGIDPKMEKVVDRLKEGESIAGRVIQRMERELALRTAMSAEEEEALKAMYLRQDIEAQGFFVTEETINKYQELLGNIRKVNTSMGQGIKDAVRDYSDSIEDVGTSAFNMVSDAFKNMEDALVSFVQTGKLDFSKMVDSMIADLTRLMIRQAIMKPLVGMFGFQDGGVFDKGSVKMLAKGGILNSPTAFSTNNGLAVAGEAGPEAVLPLRRLSNGDLGVQTAGGGVGQGGITYAPQMVINVEGGDNKTGQDQAEKIGREVNRAMEAEMTKFLSKMQRPGNMLKPQRKVF